MAPRNALVISIDRLGAGYLGPYGNTWVETPAMNRLASQSLLFENAIADSPQLALAIRSCWQGLHAVCGEVAAAPRSLAELLGAQAVTTALLTDSDELAELPLTHDFGQRFILPRDGPPQTAASVDATGVARLFAAVVERLDELSPPFLLWVHAAAMGAAWDAPYSFRQHFADEDDPAPPDFAAPPDFELADPYDPDLLLGVAQAYAGEVAALDACLAALLDALEEGPRAADTLLLLTSPRGYALGEHGWVGPGGDRLFGEVLQVPLLARLPAGRDAATRLPTLVQPPDLYATLLHWFAVPPPEATQGRDLLALLEEQGWTREVAVSRAPEQLAIRTPIWFFNRERGGQPRLFVKPDDRWEVNEVADRCQHVVEQLAGMLDEIEQTAKTGCFPAIPQLPEELVHEPP